MSANAIETLRLAVASWQHECGNEASALRMGDALAAVEALLEAAKALDSILNTGVDRDDGWEDPDTGEWVSRPSKSYRVISRNSGEASALAAAVRRVETGQ